MKPVIIDSYHYCYPEKDRTEFYVRDKYTEEEINKTIEIRKGILDFIKIVNNDQNLKCEYLESNEFYERIDANPYYGIYYLEGYGYLTNANYDRDDMDIYYFGNTYDEAFKTAIYEYVMDEGQYYELMNRKELNQDFSNRFKDGNVTEDDYYGPFFFAEYSLQLLRNFYGNNIPEELIKEFEEYVKEVEKMDVKFSYETNRFESIEKNKERRRKDGNK